MIPSEKEVMEFLVGGNLTPYVGQTVWSKIRGTAEWTATINGVHVKIVQRKEEKRDGGYTTIYFLTRRYGSDKEYFPDGSLADNGKGTLDGAKSMAEDHYGKSKEPTTSEPLGLLEKLLVDPPPDSKETTELKAQFKKLLTDRRSAFGSNEALYSVYKEKHNFQQGIKREPSIKRTFEGRHSTLYFKDEESAISWATDNSVLEQFNPPEGMDVYTAAYQSAYLMARQYGVSSVEEFEKTGPGPNVSEFVSTMLKYKQSGDSGQDLVMSIKRGFKNGFRDSKESK